MGVKCEVFAEENNVANEFRNYISDIPYHQIPCSGKLKRTPLGRERKRFLREAIESRAKEEQAILIVARDVNYGHIVTGLLHRRKRSNVTVITDVADNYDLLYASFSNPLKRLILKLGFEYLTKTSFTRSDGLLIVTPVNRERIIRKYPKTEEKPILTLRNLPLRYEFCRNENKIPKSFVYVGKIDEISRDPMYVVEKLRELDGYTLHFYSSQKESTIERIKEAANANGISDRVVFHDRVPYDELAKEISKYAFGLVPHKRNPVTDFTVPNKIYDYKSSGIVTIMSDCPSLVHENEEFGFGVIYSKENDDFVRVVKDAEAYRLDFAVPMPVWHEEFKKAVCALEDQS